MGHTLNPTTGKPTFNNTPSTVSDIQAAADYAERASVAWVATVADLENIQYPGEGDIRRVRTDGSYWGFNGTGWSVVWAKAAARTVRTASTPGISSASFTNLSLNAEWTTGAQGQLDGFTAYSNGWTIPVAGVYEISYELTATLAWLCGVSVNSASPAATDLIAISTPTNVQGFATASCKRDYRFTAGQVVRLFGIAAAGGTVLRANQGAFGLRWLGA